MYKSSRKRSASGYPNKAFKKPRQQIVPSARPRYMRVAGRASGALVVAPEKKYLDNTFTGLFTAPTTSWAGGELNPATALNLCSPGPGTAINQRVGRKILVHKLKIRGVFGFDTTSGASVVQFYPSARVVVVQDMQTNGGAALTGINAEEVMQASATTGVTNQLCTYANLATLGRFRILKDKKVVYTNGNSAGAVGAISTDFAEIPFKCSITFRKPVVVHFNATNGSTIADIVDNSFHVIGIADSTACRFSYESRAVFSDA